MKAFYNEIDPYCCAWLSNLMDAGLITPGKIDDRSIEDLRPNDLAGYERVHMFAGLGIWDYALNQAGWKGEVWTGSCPCQPFSNAGKQLGQKDERHLAPVWLNLIGECKPTVCFGEQVSSAIKKSWLDALQTHLEAEGYAVGAIVLPACGVGSPNIRQRLWFVAERLGNAIDEGLEGHAGNENDQAGRQEQDRPATETGSSSRMADTTCQQHDGGGNAGEARRSEHSDSSPDGGMANSDSPGSQPGRERPEAARHGGSVDSESGDGLVGNSVIESCKRNPGGFSGEEAQSSDERQQNGYIDQRSEYASPGMDARPGPTNGFWRDADWLFCRDGKWRPAQSGLSCLVNGHPFRLADGRTRENVPKKELLKGFGNAINAEVATEFIKAYMTCSTT